MMPNNRIQERTCSKCGKRGLYDGVYDSYIFNGHPNVILCYKCSQKWKKIAKFQKADFDLVWLKNKDIKDFPPPFITQYWRAWEKEVTVQFDLFLGIIEPEKVEFT